MSQEVRECDQGYLTFDQWKSKVNEILVKTIDLDSNCLVDIAYWDLWVLGAEPCEAAQDAIWAEYGEGTGVPICDEYLALHGEM